MKDKRVDVDYVVDAHKSYETGVIERLMLYTVIVFGDEACFTRSP